MNKIRKNIFVPYFWEGKNGKSASKVEVTSFDVKQVGLPGFVFVLFTRILGSIDQRKKLVVCQIRNHEQKVKRHIRTGQVI